MEKQILIRLSKELKDKLDEKCKREALNKSEYLRKLIEEAVKES